MDKGIRALAVHLFAERNPLRLAGELSNTNFRKGICLDLEDQCAATPSSAAMAYNYAKKKFTQEHPELVEGLGRSPEKNNGGRRRKVEAVDATVSIEESTLLEPLYHWVPVELDEDYSAAVNRDADVV